MQLVTRCSALTDIPLAYLVEIWPYALRTRGIAFFHLWGRCANFFTTFTNPIGLQNIGWKWLITYCCRLAFEVVFVWFMFPETFGRTLEELAFSMSNLLSHARFPSQSPQ
jgi:Sugar (and other) transporter